MTDYSNSSIKSFHDALHFLEPDKKKKIINKLENVVFDKQISNKKEKEVNQIEINIIILKQILKLA